jgi:hypothetical protein
MVQPATVGRYDLGSRFCVYKRFKGRAMTKKRCQRSYRA